MEKVNGIPQIRREAILASFEREMGEEKLGRARHYIDEQDGIRFDWNDKSWINFRASNTEPIIRIFGEAKTEERLEELFTKVKNIL